MAIATRRSTLAGLALLLLGGLPGRSLADYGVVDVSRERAKQLGITVTSRTRTDDVWVQVELKSAERVKAFRWADLELTQNGKRLLVAALRPQKPAADTLRVDFYVDSAMLSNATVTLFVGDEPLGGTGYRLRMKDFPPSAR